MVFGKKRSAILELARQGRLPVRVMRIGGSYRVATAELLRVLSQDQ
jgi:Helix-turn-helix domain